MQYLFSQWKCKPWREKMKIFREQTDPTQLNTPRNVCFTMEGESCRLHGRRDGICHIHLTAPRPHVPFQPITKHTSQGSQGLTEAHTDLIKFIVQFKGFAGM